MSVPLPEKVTCGLSPADYTVRSGVLMDEDPEYSSEGRVARLLIMNDKKDTFHFFSPEFFVIF